MTEFVMQEPDVVRTVTGYPWQTYLWVILLSIWGGAVNFIGKAKRGEVRIFNVVELIGELVISGFVGIITFWLCQSVDLDELITAAIVGVSSHMGTRGLYRLEQLISGVVSKKLNVEVRDDKL